ncbi:MAG: substrate-binding periplasmic protein [Alphaproteobacteria bacterium]
MANTIIVGFDTPFEPFSVLENGVPSGITVEVAAAALARIGYQATFKPLALDASEAALLSGEVDALAFKGIVDERRRIMDFSQPVVRTGAALFARAGLAATDTLAAFKGGSIATPRKGPLGAVIAREAPHIRIVATISYDDTLQAVADGAVDAAALNFHAAARMIRKRFPEKFSMPAAPFLRIPLGFTVAKGKHAALLRAFDAALAELEREGELARIEKKWM